MSLNQFLYSPSLKTIIEIHYSSSGRLALYVQKQAFNILRRMFIGIDRTPTSYLLSTIYLTQAANHSFLIPNEPIPDHSPTVPPPTGQYLQHPV